MPEELVQLYFDNPTFQYLYITRHATGPMHLCLISLELVSLQVCAIFEAGSGGRHAGGAGAAIFQQFNLSVSTYHSTCHRSRASVLSFSF